MKWFATVDRIEDGLAVLVPRDHPQLRFVLGRELLPKEIRDGSVLHVTLEVDPAAGDAAAREIADIQADLEMNR
ncbi:MAG: DUF3006 domain-containing protein [Patescibacteria group bacterium]